MVRKSLMGLVVLAVLALDWAALHDIVKGEPDTWMEWSFVIGSLRLAVIYLYRSTRPSRQG